MPIPQVLRHFASEICSLPAGVKTVDHTFTVPLDWSNPQASEEISVFAREVFLSRYERSPQPYIMYLQGGPGFPSPPPSCPPSGWLKRVLEDFRVLLLDQRGTGKSTPQSVASLMRLPDAKSRAARLEHFRADSIVEDAEAIRMELLGTRKMFLLGQSFGGFCILSYLSKYPESIEAAIFTCGLAPVGRTIDEVYRATFRRILERNRRFYERYPEDAEKIRRIVKYLMESNGVPLPRGGVLTVRRFLQLGQGLGFGGGMESMHWLLENAWEIPEEQLSFSFLCAVEAQQPFDMNPIYWLLHEAIYQDGRCHGASKWSAERVMKEFDEFYNIEELLRQKKPIMFTGEMMYPWMGQDYSLLKQVEDTAQILADKNNWSKLYDEEMLRNTKVPCAALVSLEDAFVECDFSLQVAGLLGPNCKLWITNEFQHGAIRDDGVNVLDRLLGMLKGRVLIPS